MNNCLTPIKQLKRLNTDLHGTEIYAIIANTHKKVVLSRVLLCYANEIKTRLKTSARDI